MRSYTTNVSCSSKTSFEIALSVLKALELCLILSFVYFQEAKGAPFNGYRRYHNFSRNGQRYGNRHFETDYDYGSTYDYWGNDKDSGIAPSNEWSYNKALGNGPEDWPRLYPQCAGRKQSPIDVNTYTAIPHPGLTPFVFYQTVTSSQSYSVGKKDRTIEVGIESDCFITGGGLSNRYKTKQFHFHLGNENLDGSEHSVNGRFFPFELHIVSWNYDKYTSYDEAEKQPDGLSVLGAMFVVSDYDNPYIEELIDAVKGVVDQDRPINGRIPAFHVRNLLPVDTQGYFRYYGSLTAPGCYESVTWTIYEKPQTVSMRQLQVFRNVLDPETDVDLTQSFRHNAFGSRMTRLISNCRPVQPLNGRVVYRSLRDNIYSQT